MDASAANRPLTSRLVRAVSWPVRVIAGVFRGHGPVMGVATTVASLCIVLLVWNVVIAPVLMSVMLAHIPKPVVAVEVTEAKAITWTPGLEAVGTAKAFQGADIAAEADGVIAAIDVAPQTRVSAGQRLIQIDDAVEQAELIAARANVKLSETALARASTLTKQGVSAQARLDDARNQLEVAHSALARIQAVLDQKAVKAPFDGTVGIPRVDAGQYVTKGTVLVTLQDLDRIYVDFTLPEQSAGLLALGQTARFGTAKNELDYQGRITGIDPKVDPETRLVAVRAEIAEAKGRILPGQFLQLRIDLPAESGVMALPATAVVPSLYGDYVYVVLPPQGDQAKEKAGKTGIVRQVIVKTGRRSGNLVEIRGGLEPGQRVLARGQNTVQNGAMVEIVAQADAARLAEGGAPR